jgi:hypothetical protein
MELPNSAGESNQSTQSWHYTTLLEFDVSYSQVASGRNFPSHISSLCIIHPRKNSNPEHQRRRLGIAGIKAGSSRVRATALCWHCFISHFFLGSSGNYDHQRQTDVKAMESPLKHIGLVAWRRFTAQPEEIILCVCRSEKKKRKRSQKWKGKARRPFCRSCFTGKAVADLLSTATSCCRTRGNLSSRSANSTRSHVAFSISKIYKVTVRNCVPCHASRLTAEALVRSVGSRCGICGGHIGGATAFPPSTSAIRHYHSTNAP